MKLTRTNVTRLQLSPGKSESIIFDDEVPGFGVRLRAGGKRTWIAQYRFGAKQRRLTLGVVGTLDEGEARKRAKTALSKVHLGQDPQMEKLERRAQAAVTLGSVAETYLAVAKENLKPRSFTEVDRHLRRHWAPLAENALATIQRADVASRLGAIAQENGLFAANRARAALSALFSWAIGEGIAGVNPVAGTNKATDEISRNRVLTDQELRLAWQKSGIGDYGAIIRLLILTGQRREEVAGMLWSEVELDRALWSIDASRTKNALPHDVPLSLQAIAILRGLPTRNGRDLVFGSSEGPFQGFSNAKAQLDDRMKAANGGKLKPWRLHDIRRTVATRLGDLGVQPHVVEAVLNHISGSKGGVAGIYNKAAYVVEKRSALTLWGEYVAKLVGGA